MQQENTDLIFCIRQIFETTWKYGEEFCQLFMDFNKAYNLLRNDVLYNILFEFGIPMKLLRLIRLCLTETYSRVRVGKNIV
jgi:hypothetical protein